MTHPKVLIQLDPDNHASSFDAVVAVDSGVDQLLQYSQVEPSSVRDLVHGAIFTRGPDALKNTAIFVGGSDVSRAEKLLAQVVGSFFGPMRVSVLLDANGANTTAAAAVVAASRHMELAGANATVLAGTGPVGQRVARMLLGSGCNVRLVSRQMERAAKVCDAVNKAITDDEMTTDAELTPFCVDTNDDTMAAIDGRQLVIAAGAAGVQLLDEKTRKASRDLSVVIDLNAVPPLGVEGTEVFDKAVERDGVICYGAVGVGGTKMKIHREAIRRLFTANDLVLEAQQVFEIGKEIG